MIVALLFFALVSAFTAAASAMIIGYSFWVALAVYPVAGIAALLIGAALIAFGKTTFTARQEQTDPAHA